MYQVKSKYKNPDEYIRQLKRKVDWALENSMKDYNDYVKELGFHLFDYAEDSFEDFSINSRSFGKLKVRQTVKIIGTVEEVAEKVECFKNGEDRSSIKLRLKEVRFIKAVEKE